jgi:hypothetical protein
MKRQLVLDLIGIRKGKPSGLVVKPAGITRREGIPEAPEPTIKG